VRFPTWLVNTTAVIVVLVWAVSFIVDILTENYEPPVALHGVMMIVVGALFGIGIQKKNAAKNKS
jgi:hypothetical protein